MSKVLNHKNKPPVEKNMGESAFILQSLFWELNIGCQFWWDVPLYSKSSCWLKKESLQLLLLLLLLLLLFAYVWVHICGGQRAILWKSFLSIMLALGIELRSSCLVATSKPSWFNLMLLILCVFLQWGCLCNFKRKSSSKLLSRSTYIWYIKYTVNLYAYIL